MCWRGHDDERKNKYGVCRDCHAIHMRMKRKHLVCKKRTMYRLNADVFRSRARGKMRIIADLAGISFSTLTWWIYSRKRNATPRSTSLANAKALSLALRVPFDQLWTKL